MSIASRILVRLRARFFVALLGLTACVLTSFCLSIPVAAGPRVVHLVVGGREALFMVQPIVSSDGVVYAPADFVHLLGADYKEINDHTLSITGSDGRSFTTNYFSSQDRDMAPAETVAQALGADITWDGGTRTMTLRAKLLVVRAAGGVLSIATSYPVDSETGSLDNPNRAYVDLFGVVLDSGPSTIPVRSGDVARIRTKQMAFNTVRVALDLSSPPKIQSRRITNQSRIDIALAGGSLVTPPAGSGNSAPASQPPLVVAVAPSAPKSPAPAASEPSDGYRITNIQFISTTSGQPTVIITTVGKPTWGAVRTEALDDPERFALDLPGAAIAVANASSQIAVSNPLVKAVRWGAMHLRDETYGRIVLDLTHLEPFRVAEEPTAEGTRYTIEPAGLFSAPPGPVASSGNVAPPAGDGAPAPAAPGGDVTPLPTPVAPPISSGSGTESAVVPVPNSSRPSSISNLVIVIDPGHGGRDGGAPGGGDLWEKNLTLQIAKRVCADFEGAGAKVVMTRTDDTFIPLPDRSQLGITNHADLFVSIHCDSGNSRNSNEGSTVYYHANSSICKELAAYIANRLKESNCGIRSDGTRTDYVRFPGVGFSVLRRSPEPAVLVECGYINNDSDAAALQQADTQELIAQSILAGVKDYVSNRVASN